MIILNALFSSPDNADSAVAEILGRYGECTVAKVKYHGSKKSTRLGFMLPYQAHYGSVSTGGELPTLPIPTAVNTDIPVDGDCSVEVKCSQAKKESLVNILRAHGAMSVESSERI